MPHALCPAVVSGNPADLLAYLFNPIFQTLFVGLAAGYQLFGDIGIAIIVLTLIIKTILIPLTRAQIVSQRRMQMIQPEIKALQAKFKGNRTKINEETMRLYRERGVNPASGCLPSMLQLFLLIPIYSVINTGLGAPDISSALQVFGIPVSAGPGVPCAGHASAVHQPVSSRGSASTRTSPQHSIRPAGHRLRHLDPGARRGRAAADPDAHGASHGRAIRSRPASSASSCCCRSSRSSTARSCRRACSSTGSFSRSTRSFSNT